MNSIFNNIETLYNSFYDILNTNVETITNTSEQIKDFVEQPILKEDYNLLNNLGLEIKRS